MTKVSEIHDSGSSVFFLLVAFFSINLFAQEETAIFSGDRVRVSTPLISEKIVANLVALKDDSLILKVTEQADPLTIPLASLKKFEVSRGIGLRGRSAIRGMGKGFLFGAAGGAVLGTAADVEGNDLRSEHAALLGAALFAPLGSVVGAIDGAFIGKEQWQEVPLEKIRMSFIPKRHKARIRMTVTNVPNYRFVGSLVAMDDENLFVKEEHQTTTRRFPLTSINKLEMSWGRKKPQAAPGAVIGSVVGAIIGAGLGYALGCKTGCDPEEDVLAKSSAIIGVVFGILGGSMFGAAIGVSSRSEWWEQVSLEQLRSYGNR